MGDEIKFHIGMKLSVRLPDKCECIYLKMEKFRQVGRIKLKSNIRTGSGVYRVECYRHYLGEKARMDLQQSHLYSLSFSP